MWSPWGSVSQRLPWPGGNRSLGLLMARRFLHCRLRVAVAPPARRRPSFAGRPPIPDGRPLVAHRGSPLIVHGRPLVSDGRPSLPRRVPPVAGVSLVVPGGGREAPPTHALVARRVRARSRGGRSRGERRRGCGRPSGGRGGQPLRDRRVGGHGRVGGSHGGHRAHHGAHRGGVHARSHLFLRSGKLHSFLLLPLIAEPHSDHVLLQVELLGDGGDFLSRGTRLDCKVRLQGALLRCGDGRALSLLVGTAH